MNIQEMEMITQIINELKVGEKHVFKTTRGWFEITKKQNGTDDYEICD